MIDKKKIFYSLILLALFFVVFWFGVFTGRNQFACKVCKPETIDFSLFWDAYNKLHQNFINSDSIDDQKIIYGAISGMARSLGDPYTEFFDPSKAKIFEQDLQGSFDGIGVEIGIKKDQLIIIAPLKGTPGEKAGLKSGDQIIKIDQKSTSNMSVDEAAGIIRGEKDTKVTLTIFRDVWNQTRDIKIVRDTIKIDPVDWQLKDGNIAYINIRHFNQPLSSDFKKVAFEILKSPAKKIVLDLRNNPGGYLEVSQYIAGWFLKSGQAVTIEDFGKNKNQQPYLAEGNSALAEYPMVVLINKGSASASEILAGSLKEHKNITLIGEKSFGKGSVQKVVNLEDDASFLKITIAKWLTPKGNLISEIGLNPDIKIDLTDDDIKLNKDPQLDKAIEIIRSLK